MNHSIWTRIFIQRLSVVCPILFGCFWLNFCTNSICHCAPPESLNFVLADSTIKNISRKYSGLQMVYQTKAGKKMAFDKLSLVNRELIAGDSVYFDAGGFITTFEESSHVNEFTLEYQTKIIGRLRITMEVPLKGIFSRIQTMEYNGVIINRERNGIYIFEVR